MATKTTPRYVDLITVHGTLYARCASGVHVPVETLSAEDNRLARAWVEWTTFARSLGACDE